MTAARILLIDDAKLAYDFIGSLLGEVNAGHVLEWRETYDDGFKELMKGAYDVCLLDVQLGSHSGLDMLKEVTAQGCRVPIVMLTASTDSDFVSKALAAGAVDYLIKGEFAANTLDRVIRFAIERSRVMARLRESEERYALALNGANDGLWDWRISENQMHLSPRWKAILGFAEDELANSTDSWWERVHADDRQSLARAFEAHFRGDTTHFEHEHRLMHKDGSWRHVLVRGQAVRAGERGAATRLTGSLTDVTGTKGRDALTGLPNRVLFQDRVENAFHRSRRDNSFCFALLFVDLDRFKNVNDSLGHDAGDRLLVSIARRLEKCVRVVDTVARLGGDEFAIMLEDPREPDGASRVAGRIVEELSKAFTVDGRDVFTGASVGIVYSSPAYLLAGEMIRDADTAMNRAKASGRGRCVVFDAEMHARAMAVLSVESGLRRAVEERQLEVHYQPVVNVGDRMLIGFEALVRWRHPDRGLVLPGEFVNIAEDSSLIVLVDLYVLREACAQLARWRRIYPDQPLFMSVNASRRQFTRPNFAEDVAETVRAAQLPAEAVRLEVTETVTMDGGPVVDRQLEMLREIGVPLLADDFGIGYSSLALLQKYPFAGLKIDRSFISRLGPEKKSLELVRAIVTMSNALGLKCTAEGVETEEQFQQLRQLNCDHAQGFLFSKGISAEAATLMLQNISGRGFRLGQ